MFCQALVRVRLVSMSINIFRSSSPILQSGAKTIEGGEVDSVPSEKEYELLRLAEMTHLRFTATYAQRRVLKVCSKFANIPEQGTEQVGQDFGTVCTKFRGTPQTLRLESNVNPRPMVHATICLSRDYAKRIFRAR